MFYALHAFAVTTVNRVVPAPLFIDEDWSHVVSKSQELLAAAKGKAEAVVLVVSREGSDYRYYRQFSKVEDTGEFTLTRDVAMDSDSAYMLTCSCGNDHGAVSVLLGCCPWEFN